jgi:hypothetical protein
MTARLLTLALLAFAAALFSAIPAAAKDGVRAKLTTNVPLDAKAGTKLVIAWRLAYVEEGKRRLFGGSGVFVRLGSATGSAAETGFADEDSGNYTATVAVPEGGIGDIEIGIRGYTSGYTSRRRSDLLFPIANDPLPGVARIALRPPAQSSSERAESGRRTWIIAPVAASLIAISVAFVVAARRKPRRRPIVQALVRPG